MDLGIAGRNALITGGSRGLGRQCAISLGGEGVNVAICGRTESTINATVDELTGLGVRAVGIVADVTQIDDLARLHGDAVEGLGPIDILVNNAGGSMGATDLPETPSKTTVQSSISICSTVTNCRASCCRTCRSRAGAALSTSHPSTGGSTAETSHTCRPRPA